MLTSRTWQSLNLSRVIYRAGEAGFPKLDELTNSRGGGGLHVFSVIDHDFRHNIVKVDVDPRGDSRVDPQTPLIML